MNPEVLMIESDHDMRNSADFLVIDRVAKAMFHLPGIGRVQAITRPAGHADRAHLDPVHDQHAGRTQQMNQTYQQDRMKDMLKHGRHDMQVTIDSMAQDVRA